MWGTVYCVYLCLCSVQFSAVLPWMRLPLDARHAKIDGKVDHAIVAVFRAGGSASFEP